MDQYLTRQPDKRIICLFIRLSGFSQTAALTRINRINTYRFIRVSGGRNAEGVSHG